VIRQRAATAALLCALFLSIAPACAFAQEHTPAPYSPDEFPAGMKDLWRAEVLFVGSFPFTFFFTIESYDIARYLTNKLDQSYAPWPLRSAVEIGYSDQEKAWLIASAVAFSAVVAGIDFLLGRLNSADNAR
jgi:hypothetical protein